MIGFIFFGIPLICIIALIVMGCSGGSKTPGYKGTTVFLENEEDGFRCGGLHVSRLRLLLQRDAQTEGGQPDISQIHDHPAVRADDALPGRNAHRSEKTRCGERRG